jgi:hypothetical protein
MMNHQQLLEYFYSLNPKWNVRANDDRLILNTPRPVTVEELGNTANRIGHTLATNQDFARTFREFYAENPQRDCEANTDHLVRLHRGDPITLESLREVSQSPQCHLTVNAATLAQQQADGHRENLIQEITQGRTKTYGWHDPRHGTMKYFPVEHLAGETTERLEEIASILREQRRIINTPVTPPAERRKESAPTAQSETFRELINPLTGAEYTASELKRLNRSEYRRILCLPGGQVKAPVANRITQILKGQN